MGVAVIDIFERVNKADRGPAGKPCEGIGKRVRARPPHPLEQKWQVWTAPGADQPEPAIRSRAENEIVSPEQAKGGGDVMPADCRDVAADEQHRTARLAGDGVAHAPAEVATTLSKHLYPPAPMPGMEAGSVGRHRDTQIPAPVVDETTQQPRDHQPLEAYRREVADFVCQPALAVSQHRGAHKQHEMTPHQP